MFIYYTEFKEWLTMNKFVAGFALGIGVVCLSKILKRRGLTCRCFFVSDDNDFVSKKEKKHAEYDAGKTCNYFGE